MREDPAARGDERQEAREGDGEQREEPSERLRSRKRRVPQAGDGIACSLSTARGTALRLQAQHLSAPAERLQRGDDHGAPCGRGEALPAQLRSASAESGGQPQRARAPPAALRDLRAPAGSAGFSTAGGRAVHSDEASLQAARGLLEACTGEARLAPHAPWLGSDRTSGEAGAVAAGFATAGGRALRLDEAQLRRARDLLEGSGVAESKDSARCTARSSSGEELGPVSPMCNGPPKSGVRVASPPGVETGPCCITQKSTAMQRPSRDACRRAPGESGTEGSRRARRLLAPKALGGLGAPAAPLGDPWDVLFALFRCDLETASAGPLERLGRAWFETQRRLLSLAGCGDARPQMARLRCWFRRRGEEELSGKPSAFRRLCEQAALGERHLVLFVVSSLASGARIELSDGRYILPADLDSPLQQLARAGRLRPGRWLHTCLIHTLGLPAEGCDPVLPPRGFRLQLSFNGCRPCRLASRDASGRPPSLGFQRRPFPPALVAELQGWPRAVVPLLDVVVLRRLPVVFKSWGGRCGRPSERSASEERLRLELLQEELLEAGAEAREGLEASFEASRSLPELPLLVADAQSQAPGSMALLALPCGEDSGPRVGDRLRITCAKICASGHWGLRLAPTRASRLQLSRGAPHPERPGLFCDLVGRLVHAEVQGEPPSLGLVFLTASMQLCRITVEDPERGALERARSTYLRVASPACAAENLLFEGRSRSGLALFRARRLQLRVSRSPASASLRAELQRAAVLAEVRSSHLAAMLRSAGVCESVEAGGHMCFHELLGDGRCAQDAGRS